MTITFYATMSCDHLRPYMADVPVLLPASSWSRVNMRKPNLPPHVKHVAADSGGFVATFKWGDYRYTPDEYVRWLNTFAPRWAATMDYCCEDEITGGKVGVVKERQQRTSEMAYRFWRDYKAVPWAWCVTVQGWEVEDYIRHAKELRPLLQDMKAVGHPDFRVGIGTLCHRASAKMVQRVAQAVADELPSMPLHLWGVKLLVLRSAYELPGVISVDSAAWDVSGMGRDGAIALKDRQAKGLTQKEYAHHYSLPRYLRMVDAALATPKSPPPPRQKTLWEML